MNISRTWAMPAGDTFDCKPIGEFVKRYLSKSRSSVDPFARNNQWSTWSNDLNPNTTAKHHLEASEFLALMNTNGVKADLAIFDPPYSPRQISELYQQIGRPCTTKDTQNALLYKTVRDAFIPILTPDAIVLSFGWNSSGMGKGRGFEIIEILMVCHGGAHNDTICMAERLIQPTL